jgi:protein-disulfide isomerase
MSSRTRQKQANRIVREQMAREARRRRTIIVSIVAVAALVVAGLASWAIYNSQKPSSYSTPAHAVQDNSGIQISSGKVQVDAWVDFLCPICKQFETSAQSTIDSLVSSNKITMVYHPVAILDQNTNPTGYSTRAAAASGCAADLNKFPEFLKALYAQQPAEGSAGLSDDQLIQVGGSVGLIDPAFAKCVRDGKYASWATHNTDVFSGKGYTGTPTIVVAGKVLQAPTGDSLKAAVDAASK